jgi:hypothetical protein
MKTKLKVKALSIARLDEKEIPSDVMERIHGYEEFENDENEIYPILVFKKIVKDKQDDTNETTKLRIKEIYKQVKDFDYVMIK